MVFSQVSITEMRVHCGSAVSCGFQANLTSPYIYFFSVHFVEEQTFSHSLEICLQIYQNVSEYTKSSSFYHRFSGGGGHAPKTPLAYAHLIALVIVIPLSFFPFDVLISAISHSVAWMR